MKFAFIFPGQGSQSVGMGKDFFEHYPVAKKVFEEADRLLEFSLSSLMFQGTEEELKKTLHSQLAIFVMSWAVLKVMEEKFHLHPHACAGLSLGEYTALCASKRLSFAEGLALVKERALLMNEACQKTSGTMAAVLGLNGEIVDGVIGELSLSHEIWVANYNCPGQIVISGSFEGVKEASKRLKEKGAKRILPLQVDGAFHSGLMESAQQGLKSKIMQTPLRDSSIDFVMNVPGDYVRTLDDVKKYLIQQVTHSVRWESGILNMQKKGITCFLEMGWGKTLTGMNKKMVGNALAFAVEKVDDLAELKNAIGG